MNQVVVRPRLSLTIPDRKDVEPDPSPHLKRQLSGGSLSPDLTPVSPPSFPLNDSASVLQIGKYLLNKKIETLQLQSGVVVEVYAASHLESEEECICKVLPIVKYREVLSAYWCMGSHENINEVTEIILGDTKAYVFFPQHYGDLHSYIRSRRKLKEVEACPLFLQIVSAVRHCHSNGVVLRDLKLRKFVFKDPERTQLKLESLEDACVLDDEDDDSLVDKHGCPAYVSPEILTTMERYSGKAADMWSLGVILYTMLIGRYPFQDSDAGALFKKIRRGLYSITDAISSRAKCLIRSLLRMNPHDRLNASDVIHHPWFGLVRRSCSSLRMDISKDKDQLVPNFESHPSDFEFS